MKQELFSILEQLEDDNVNKQSLGYEALGNYQSSFRRKSF